MFYKEKGIPHFKCDVCGSINKITRETIERWFARINFEDDGIPEDENPTFSSYLDEWFECACGAEICEAYGDMSELQRLYAEAEEINHD